MGYIGLDIQHAVRSCVLYYIYFFSLNFNMGAGDWAPHTAVTLKSTDKCSPLIRRWLGIDSVSPPGGEWRDRGDWDEKRGLKACLCAATGGVGLWEDRIGKTRQLDRVKTRVIDEAEERQRRIKGREEYKRERLNQSEWMKERRVSPRRWRENSMSCLWYVPRETDFPAECSQVSPCSL